ncbi:MAG: DUF5667 domain-containing protein [Candidatus Levybacteria bacterium]|nr:DUF5667 domain-containing protein [Candidatus Levybacteria bacterium]
MKRAVFFGIFLLFTAFFVRLPAVSHAQEAVVETDTLVGIDINATESAATGPARINYELPYPGMLPDHPLYILKVVRDGIVKMLINDPVKRARFSLLAAEKRMNAGKMLVEKQKDGLAVETISKANNYLDDALKAINSESLEEADSIGKKPFLQQFHSATMKHLEISYDIEPLIDKEAIDQFNREQKRIEVFVKTAELLLL